MALLLHRGGPVRLLWVLCALSMTGCVTVYQPLMGLHQPIAVDPQQPGTFDGTRVLLRCHPGDGVEPDVLCRNLRSSLTKQGATVTTEVVKPSRAAPPASDAASLPEFIVEVTSRIVHEDSGVLSAIACGLSFTLFPATSETTYAQDVSIRDRQGFLLAQRSLQERFIFSFGFGVWAVNGLVDLIIRPKEEQVTGDRYREEFTRDLHGQIAQQLYNARVKTRVLRSFEPAAGPPPKAGAP